MKRMVQFAQVNICLMRFQFRMVWNGEMLYRHYFLASLKGIPLGRSKFRALCETGSVTVFDQLTNVEKLC